MAKQRVAIIVTVLNEESTISLLLDSILEQSLLPDEVVIVDGGSIDRTVRLIKGHPLCRKVSVKVIVKRGNIAEGRNEAVKHASASIIAITDAGCVLNINWLKNITKPFSDYSVDIVAGYYKGLPENNFQKCLVPYVLVMPDKVNKDTFLPSSRSMAITTTAFRKLEGFSRDLNQAEDYEFALRARRRGMKIIFEKRAIVFWIPRSSISETFIMFYRYAHGDIRAKILRPKVVMIFLRYFFALCVALFAYSVSPLVMIFIILLFFAAYSSWAVMKNYKYVKDFQGVIYLPVIQFISDIAVILGSTRSFINNFMVKYK